MYSFLLLFHSYLRYAVLFLIIFVIIKTFLAWQSKQNFTKSTATLSLYLLIVTHIQLLLGIALYFVSPLVRWVPMAQTMKDPVLRFWTVEHASLMLIAIALITVGRVRLKKIDSDLGKHKNLFFYNLVALVLILAAIPWMRH